jgi:hypothetical protein|tara:strand:+ start:165 stop:449 length:285 start_codon:yes stop_codon:yes gene_type:complete
MRVRNKEHQSLSIIELQQLCDDFPNDQQLGEEIRSLTNNSPRATVNNPKGTYDTSLNYIKDTQIEEAHKLYEDNPSDIERDYEEPTNGTTIIKT